jgi:hypothetical protein
MACEWQIGDIVEVADKIDPENQPTVTATIKYIEPDEDIEGLNWLYLIANEEVLNVTDVHPIIGPYWAILEDCNNYIRLLSRPTVS